MERAREAGRPRRRHYRITPEGSRALALALERLGLLAAPSGPLTAEQA